MINVINAPTPIAPANFDLLSLNKGMISGQNLGGKFALPVEFDTNSFVGGFYRVGQEASAMSQQQPLIGTKFIAPGWAVWKYPGKTVKENADDTKKKKKKVDQAGLPGQPHYVAGLGQNENYVLMFRPRAVQDQVNRAYADLSLTNMVSEARGETLAEEVQKSGGMLPAKLLTELGERDMEADREYEETKFGRSAAVHGSSLPSNGGRIQKEPQRVHR